MKYNIWSIEKVLSNHVEFLNSKTGLTNEVKVEIFEEGIKDSIKYVLEIEWPEKDKGIIVKRIGEILLEQKIAWSN
jgi:CDP-glycerol glycerophosphotransferase (TagB/SpsB family)